MTRMEFMQALQRELHDISSEEREAALQYYNDYLDDAGPEDEQSILREWGSPGQLAESIRNGMDGKLENGEFTENGFSTGERGQYPAEHGQSSEREQEGGGAKGREGRGENAAGTAPGGRRKERRRPNGWKILAIVLLCILLAPICLPVGIAVVAVLISLLVIAVGVLLTVFFCWILIKCSVWMFRKLVDLCRKPLHGRRRM